MKRLLEQLDSIEAIIDTVSPSQIEDDPLYVASRYDLYAKSYDPIDRVKILRDRLIAEILKGKPVNGYLSADYGYGKTATLVYLWHECQRHQIVAVPPFKFKELGNLMVATYGWIKACGIPSELISQVEVLYNKYGLKSLQIQAAEIARQHKVSEDKAIKILQQLKIDTTNTDTVLNFWQEIVPILQEAGLAGLAIFADESQEFLRTEEGASARIQILSDLVKGMRALGSTPVALILGMPTDPTESAIEEQAGDIIHRMKEQKVSLRLADAYNYEFPRVLWDSLCEKFLDDKSQHQLAHPALIESLGQLCDRKDLTCGPRAVIEVFKRLVHFVQEKGRAYTPLDLIEDYLEGRVQFYGAQQHKINNAIDSLEQLTPIQKHPQGRDVIKLLALFPAGVSETVAEQFGLLENLKELADNDDLYGLHIIQPTERSFALVSLCQPTTSTVVDKILNRFRQQWYGEWDNTKKEEMATTSFQSEIISSLFPVSRTGQKANWTWRYKDKWKQAICGFYNLLTGSPERYHADFPNRSLVISIGTEKTKLMRFTPPEETHLDWRFYLSYDREAIAAPQRLTAIAGTGQVDFYIQLGRSFEREYPTAFGLLSKVIPAKHCSAGTLLSLSYFIRDWLLKNPEVSKADRARLEYHRQECHQYAMRLLFPAIQPETWVIEGLEGINGAETKLIESVFYQKCKALFPQYKSFYNNLRPTLLKYKLVLEKAPLAVRQGRQLYQVTKEEFEKLFETAGSGLPSILAIFKHNSLINEYKIAGKKEEDSKVKFSEHPLELFIEQQLKSRGRTPTIEMQPSWQDIKALEYLELWEEVKNIGYLQEEFEEAIEWLQRRRYVEWERATGILRTCVVAEIDSDVLRGLLNELRSQVSLLLEIFDERILHEVNETINETQKTFENDCDSEVALDQVQRNIQAIKERIEIYRSGKWSALQKEMVDIKFKLGNCTRELNFSKVSQPIISNSGLEICLNDYRKNLERQINQLDKDCQKQAISIRMDETDIRQLHHQLEQHNQYLKDCEGTKRRLQPLVEGLEHWRIILTRAEALRENLTSDTELEVRYEDEFVDRVVKRFSTHQIESFREYEKLQRPLVEIEEQINGERRSRREAFVQQLSQYEELLAQVVIDESYLRDRCKFDDEDRNGSYNILRQVVWEKLSQECDSQISEWEQLESNLSFLYQEREQDVTELLHQFTNFKAELFSQINLLSSTSSDLEKIKKWVNELKIILEKSQNFREELKKIIFQKDEQLLNEEQQLLNVIIPAENGLTISQIRQRLSYNRDIWELLKDLYKKGHLEITLHQRD